VARHSRLDGYRLDLAAAVAIHPKLSLGIGPIIDQLRLDWARDEQLFYPASGNLEDVGFSRLRSRSKTTVGISAGLLADGIGRWSLGLRWTRPGEMRFRGGGQYVQQPTGDPALDQFAASRLPFGQTAPWRADWMSAEEWVVGAAYQIKPTMVLELDLERRRRRRARQLQIEFLGAPTLDRTPLQRWDETTAARVGLRWSGLGNGEWRAGASYEPSPQPSDDADPFLALGDRVAASIGFGTRVRRVQADVALRAERRHTLRIRDSVDGFTGRYRNRRIRVVVTFAW
jgi:long-subunit fatty acid transport protein